jgi:hypothetical protein
MDATLSAALTRYATSDLRCARREGYLLVAQTKKGTLALSYVDGAYTLSTVGPKAEVLASGKAGTVRPVLVGVYDIVVEG